MARSPIGGDRLFPFRSQTEDHGVGARHVHVEIERDGSMPLPGCGVTNVMSAPFRDV